MQGNKWINRVGGLFSLLLIAFAAQSQMVHLVHQNKKTSLRGLSVVSDKIVWVSGSNGAVGRSVDSGRSWKWINVPGFEKTDFRDIEAFDEKTAIIMGVDSPAYVLKTTDGGEHWKIAYEKHQKGIFLDAMEFWNQESGIIVGDPIDNRFFVIRSFDGGDHWQEIPTAYRPEADSGEACFAASGTNVKKIRNEEAIFVSGGLRSRLFILNQPVTIPIIQGKNSTGANSVAIHPLNRKKERIMIVGGDFYNDTIAGNNCAFSDDRGKNWKTPTHPPNGYRSCVEFVSSNVLVTCGTSGVDISRDGGNYWELIDKRGFHVCRKAKKGNIVFLAGGNGKIGRIIF